MSVQLCLALLALSSLTAASDPGCDELTKPLEDRSKIYGKWIFHSATSESEEQMKVLKTANSSLIEITPLPGSDEFNLHFADRLDGNCLYGEGNSTTSGNFTKMTFYIKNTASYETSGKYLETCPDCVLWMEASVRKPKIIKSLYLFTKTGKLDASQLAVFKKQAECFNITLDFYFPDTINLCPEEKEAAEDVKTEEQ
ncbi:uncharacterized protein [Leuresthes tenuis]|uniref:uncharacterized protein isoform X3 n=1 Tax=Leuresthes tenuis TaxID=355514 RepID=UPI003B5066B9